MRAELGLVQGLPLAAGAQHVEDRISTGAIGDARASSAEAMLVDMDRQEGLEHRPEGIGDAKAGGGSVIGRARTLALWWVGAFFFHTSKYIRLFG